MEPKSSLPMRKNGSFRDQEARVSTAIMGTRSGRLDLLFELFPLASRQSAPACNFLRWIARLLTFCPGSSGKTGFTEPQEPEMT